MAQLKVALDWTPNTNHAGFYVAKAKGYFQEANQSVQFLSPHLDGYKATPASKVADGSADFAIAPSETVISYNTQPKGSQKPKLQAVAALLQTDTSAIVTLASSGLDRPKKLDGKVYGSYGARYEGRIVQQLIRNDGGQGDFKEVTPPMLEIWDQLLQGHVDSTWVFMAWEGILAKHNGVDLNSFSLSDFKVPYGYSPVLLAAPASLSDKSDTVKAFLDAVTKGYKFVASHPDEAAQLFLKQVEADHSQEKLPALDVKLVAESLQMLSHHFLTPSGAWGSQDVVRWNHFLDWLSKQGLLTTTVQSRNPQEGQSASLDDIRGGKAGNPISCSAIDAASLFTNAFLPESH